VKMQYLSKTLLLLWLVCSLLLGACAPATPSPEDRSATLAALVIATDTALTKTAAALPTATPTLTFTPTLGPSPTATPSPPTPTLTSTATLDTRPTAKYWPEWPIVPTVSAKAIAIYQKGLALGNNPRLYSAIGDCQSEPNVFLGVYDTTRYTISNYEFLQDTIDYYKGSFQAKSYAVRDGLSAPSALDPLWADSTSCQVGETPVVCDLRLRKPGVVFINLGTNWKAGASAQKYEEYLRQIVDIVIAHGALPVLSTKSDNVEGDHSLNLATARVAYDYDIPLWNFWLATQTLPNNGLDASRNNVYLTPDGWARRNFTGLQVLDAIRRALNGLPPPPKT
jgi:hypothetical protein